MLVNKSVLQNIFTNLKATYNKAFKGRETTWQKIAMKVTSTSSQNDYAWLSKFPKMRKWVGEKNVKSLAAQKYTIVNDDYEATVEVDRNDIEDDNIGIYGPQAMAAGESAAELPDDIVNQLLINGHKERCFDGQYFFDTDHPSFDENGDEITVSNSGYLELSTETLAKAQNGYGATRTAMQQTKDEEGRSLGVKPNLLVVGPALEDTARALLTVDRLEDGKPNPYKGTAELLVITDIQDTSWFLFDTTRPVKPFIYQERKAPDFVSQTDMNADDVFTRRKYKFGAEARAAGGYGFWQLAYRNKYVV
ncbi:MAG: Mu-like prophage major head subunit gpT family protein [Oceanospirillaceae bacterium]|nr:Mu-like prophage major head subunit gpT family protein [Oceanospirillaceae bacterium]